MGALADGGLHVALVERDLVGGECSYYAYIPSKSLLRPGEAVQQARDAGTTAQVEVQAALDWRDFMVSGYSDSGQADWLAAKGVDLLRGTGRLAGPGVVEVDGQRHAARDVVVATGSEPDRNLLLDRPTQSRGPTTSPIWTRSGTGFAPSKTATTPRHSHSSGSSPPPTWKIYWPDSTSTNSTGRKNPPASQPRDQPPKNLRH